MPGRNALLIRGVEKYGRAAAYKKSGRWALKNKKAVAPNVEKTITKKTKKFGKGEERTIEKKHQREYSVDDVRRPLEGKARPRPAHLRKSITPGTVLILLAGRFRGKRVVFVKRLSSGLLLVTGPYKFNGVPLRRVNPAYVIATSTKLDVSSVKVPTTFNDSYFKKSEGAKGKSEEAFFEAAKANTIDPAKIAAQKEFDAGIIAAAGAVPQLQAYLSARFSLKRGQAPHALTF